MDFIDCFSQVVSSINQTVIKYHPKRWFLRQIQILY